MSLAIAAIVASDETRMLALSLELCVFQAEDGIRDVAVTGVQTCALPIYGELVAAALDRKCLGHKTDDILANPFLAACDPRARPDGTPDGSTAALPSGDHQASERRTSINPRRSGS